MRTVTRSCSCGAAVRSTRSPQSAHTKAAHWTRAPWRATWSPVLGTGRDSACWMEGSSPVRRHILSPPFAPASSTAASASRQRDRMKEVAAMLLGREAPLTTLEHGHLVVEADPRHWALSAADAKDAARMRGAFRDYLEQYADRASDLH